jgi:Arm DNA-binding domain
MAEKTKKARALTAKAIEAIKPADDAYRVPDSRCTGLSIRVASDGGKTWGVAYRIKGKGVRRSSLGRYGDVGLKAARKRANDLTEAARLGRDLIAKEKADRNEYDLSFTVKRLVADKAPPERAAEDSGPHRTPNPAHIGAGDGAQSNGHPPPRCPPTARRNRGPRPRN